ncbi:MAG: 2-hydroxychromene-2-carboxylate isomerase [Alphaproteobacteria bacterium]|nr:2-hydroxychromene-2-carboxylate isomerase [Alphaproteobacteria bacterium]
MAEIEFFFDISSPWTYLAFHNLPTVAAEFGAEIAYRPFLVGGVFNTVNPSVYSSRERPIPAKDAYYKKDLQDWARYTGLRIGRPSTFPLNSVRAMRACIVLDGQGKLVPFARAAFEAYWGDDKDISQHPELALVAARAGVDADALFEAIEQQPVKDALRANTQQLIDRGGYGSPTIFVGGDDMYFGNDRMPLIRAALERRRQI